MEYYSIISLAIILLSDYLVNYFEIAIIINLNELQENFYESN